MDTLEERVTDLQERMENSRRSHRVTQEVAQFKTHELFISRTYQVIVD